MKLRFFLTLAAMALLLALTMGTAAARGPNSVPLPAEACDSRASEVLNNLHEVAADVVPVTCIAPER